ncbi:MAG: DMT family transporter, partial [Pseudomonadota bacterium]
YLKITSLFIGFCGAIIVIQPFDADFNYYYLIAIISSFLWAISLIYTKKLSVTQSPITITFYFSIINVMLSLFFILPIWQWPNYSQWVYLIICALLTILVQYSIIKAFSYADLTTLMPVSYSEIIFATIFAYFIFGDIVKMDTIIGSAIILASTYIIFRAENIKNNKLIKPRP